jgi:hypothetical protein
MDTVVYLSWCKTGLYAVASDVTQLVENQTALNAADNFSISH